MREDKMRIEQMFMRILSFFDVEFISI